MPTRPVSLLLDQISYDLNIATATRNHLVFGSRAVIVGCPEAPKVAGQYRVTHTPDSHAAIDEHRARGYQIIAFDLVEGSTPLWEHRFDQRSLLVFGKERDGLSTELLEKSDRVIHIPQYGSTRSLNVGTSTGIALYEYARQYQSDPQ
jgi:tRNA G18 (ribose-2'-O)-methylase SpoU